MRAVRWLLGAVGVATAAYGAWLLWDRQRPDQVLAVGGSSPGSCSTTSWSRAWSCSPVSW
jgi:hypothetical protein